jgi:hypothetical protein
VNITAEGRPPEQSLPPPRMEWLAGIGAYALAPDVPPPLGAPMLFCRGWDYARTIAAKALPDWIVR